MNKTVKVYCHGYYIPRVFCRWFFAKAIYLDLMRYIRISTIFVIRNKKWPKMVRFDRTSLMCQ